MSHQTTIVARYFSLLEARKRLGLFAEAFNAALVAHKLNYIVVDNNKVITESELNRFQATRMKNDGSMDSTV